MAVIDTDVLSFLLKGGTRGALYEPYLIDRAHIVTFMTRAELYVWADTHHWGARRRQRLERFLERHIHYDSHPALCQRWAAIRTQAQRAGRAISRTDAWQAAVALHEGVPLISHNRRDFAAIPGLALISEAP